MRGPVCWVQIVAEKRARGTGALLLGNLVSRSRPACIPGHLVSVSRAPRDRSCQAELHQKGPLSRSPLLGGIRILRRVAVLNLSIRPAISTF